MRVLFALVALLVCVSVSVSVSAQGLTGPNFWINDGDGANYQFAVIGNDPDLSLNVGTTYNFILNKTMTTHPFGFAANSTAQVSNFSSPALGGVTTKGSCVEHTIPFSWITNNITDPCIVSITPNAELAGLSLYYRCSVHSNMNGMLTAVGATSAPTSTSAPTTTSAPTNSTPTTPAPQGGDAACIVPGAIAVIAVAINALFSA